jgi:hypothetical protein
MAREDYKIVLDEFCALTGISDAAALFETGLLKVDETPVRLEYIDLADLCRIAVDLGQPAGGYQEGLYRLMLESNFIQDTQSLSLLTIEPVTGHAVLMVHVPVSSLLGDLPLAFLLGPQLDTIRHAWSSLLDQIDEENFPPAPAAQAQPSVNFI